MTRNVTPRTTALAATSKAAHYGCTAPNHVAAPPATKGRTPKHEPTRTACDPPPHGTDSRITSTLATNSTPLRSPARQNPASAALAASGSPEPTTPLSSMVLHARDHLPGPSAHGPCGPPHLSLALPVANQPFSSLAAPSCRGRSLRRRLRRLCAVCHLPIRDSTLH